MKWALPIIILVTVMAGCAKPVVTKLPPLAYIDSVSSSQIYAGDKIAFVGHGVSGSGEIVAYSWRSSINGDLSTMASFDTTALSAGQHTIWLKVQDNYGSWSNDVGTNVEVLVPGGPTKMVIRVFTASPPAIRVGEQTNLTWDVAGSGRIKIDPDIGDVSLSGSRTIRPMHDTLYTLIATNDQGVVNATVKVDVTTVPLHVLTTYSIAAEDGTVRKDRTVLDEVLVGQNELQLQMQGFLSFDISTIPPNAIIKSVELDISNSTVYGSPFPWQGSLIIYNQQYGSSLRGSNYMVMNPAGYVFNWNYNSVMTMMPQVPFSSPDFVITVQKQADARNDRYQLRLQFEKYYYYARLDYSSTSGAEKMNPDSASNYIDVGSGKPKLTIRYIIPGE
ncbi:MAG: hypothetical protein NT082_01505 [Chloroflexi bacterium]|nr:hypothetical protein [Chloroflexota bacterium]